MASQGYDNAKAHFEFYANLRGLGPYYVSKNSVGDTSKPYSFGKLSTKHEPAGKIRVFAMVDVWTQSILKPLHDTLFSFLKNLPNDGTFDQQASVKRCVEKATATGGS